MNQKKNDSVAQLVEQLTLNQWAEGSSPSGVTLQKRRIQQTPNNQSILGVFLFYTPAKHSIIMHLNGGEKGGLYFYAALSTL